MARKQVVLKKALGERIKRFAQKNDISLSALEAQVGYSAGMFTRWTNASEDDNFEIFSKLATIASILRVSVDELLGVAELQPPAVRFEEKDLISCITASTKAEKLLWTETDWKNKEELSQSMEPEEHIPAISWSAERGRIYFLLTAYCDDLDDDKEPMSLQLYAAAGHGIPPQPIRVEPVALQTLYLTIQLQAVHQSLVNDTVGELLIPQTPKIIGGPSCF